MGSILVLLIALILDAIIGDPEDFWKKIPHPVVLMGKLIKYYDQEFNLKSGNNRKQAGLIGLLVGSVAFVILGLILEMLPFIIIDVIIVAVLLAQKSLIQHAKEVMEALGLSLMEGRLAVAKIVGRDTSHLDESEVVRATVESTAEGFLDGVFAPIFWYLVAGLPGLLVYKFVNTADSMIGYKNEQYEEFGWATAKFDDILNYLPARIIPFIISIALLSLSPIKLAFEDGSNHRSPNAGWPEAAFASALGIALSGPRSYDGELRQYPFINQTGRMDLVTKDIKDCIKLAWKGWATSLAILVALWVIF
ncbi:MAG: adenosylcobinamide-phosphate synthase CbiB [Paracoccaceae bacterium]|nr:adenosylcobinamide-phosphate synthase CbiB [Paracoccaceae bacterium]MDE2674411.1 adenosylcobinamide-phosphate synthase CbiB [Paracoccaceae bacterium]MXZ50968.1 cobalamin biosynthesis protein CobD [Paracoccaceae bacterium]MYF45946.1 cobalamin biosynthesis protein CobD [Paracoccaceae bacterium]MYG10490.1 cobalamin biosynthesis protein CobD [Paracoccaceae bacterium]